MKQNTVLVVVLVGLVALLLPPTRAIVFLVLPLGSGWDDLLFIGLAVTGTALLVHRKYEKEEEWWQKNRKWFAIIIACVMVALLIFIMMVI